MKGFALAEITSRCRIVASLTSGIGALASDDPSMDCKYPDVTVPLTELNGNAFVLIAATRKALRRHGVDSATVDAFSEEARSGDYDNVLQTIMQWVETS